MSLRTTIVIALASVAANALPVQNEVIAYTRFSGQNAYDGHGGTPLPPISGIPHTTMHECKSMCNEDPACQCVVSSPTTCRACLRTRASCGPIATPPSSLTRINTTRT